MSLIQFDAPGSDACRSLARLWPLLAIFVFLLPFSLTIGGLGVSANYSFLALLFLLRPLTTWPRLVWLVVAYSIVIYLNGAIFMATDAPQFYLRQLASFLLFLGPLLVAVTRMPFDFEDLAYVIAVTAAAYSIAVVVALMLTGIPATNAGMIKLLLSNWIPDWPQRFIMVVMLGFFLALLLARQSRLWLLAAGLCGFCIVISYGRAAGFAMTAGITLLTLLQVNSRDWAGLKNLAISVGLAGVMTVLIVGQGMGDLVRSETRLTKSAGTLILEKPWERAIGTLPSKDARTPPETIRAEAPPATILLPPPNARTPPETIRAEVRHIYAEGGEASGKIRLIIWSSLLERMMSERMLLGSGFAGYYLYDSAIGSTHSQYLDIMFRMGPVGLCLYLGLWGVLVLESFRQSRELGCAMLAWFLFGFFNETTKYSYGSFLFFTLLSFSWYGWKRSYVTSPVTRMQ
jgi:hypothetical protein